MKPNFPMQALLELREAERDEASAAVESAQSMVDNVGDAIEALEAHRREIEARRRNARGELGGDLARMRLLDEYIRALDVEIDKNTVEVADHQVSLRAHTEVLRAAQEVLTASQISLRAIEAGRDKWLAALRAREERAEEEAAEEVAITQWRSQNE